MNESTALDREPEQLINQEPPADTHNTHTNNHAITSVFPSRPTRVQRRPVWLRDYVVETDV